MIETQIVAEVLRKPRNTDTLVSVCALVPEESGALESFLRKATATLEADFEHFELLLIDNGATAETHSAASQLQRVLPNIRMLRLSRRYNRELALAAALDHSIGDYVVVMDALEHPPELIPGMLAKAMSGCDAVIAEPRQAAAPLLDSWVVKPAARVASRLIGFAFRPNESYFRVFSRRLVNSLIRIRSKNRYLSSMNGLVGLRKATVTYEPAPGMVLSTGRFLRQLTIMSDVVVSNSAAPLRFAGFLGLLASALNLLYLFYILAVTLIKSQIAEGWLTSSIMHTVMFLFLFLIMAILAEYVARILDESKQQPLYFVESESTSNVSSAVLERLNVV